MKNVELFEELSNNECFEIAQKWNTIDGIYQDYDISFEEALKFYSSIDKSKRVMFVMKDSYVKDADNESLFFTENETIDDSFIKITNAYTNNDDINSVRSYLTNISDRNADNKTAFIKIAASSKWIIENKKGESSFIIDGSYNQYTKKIAFININKEFWGLTSGEKHISSAYKKYRTIQLSQIMIIDPGVIIFCGTFKYFKEDLKKYINITSLQIKNIKYDKKAKQLIQCYISTKDSSSSLIINTYHPRWWNKSTPYIFTQVINKWINYEEVGLSDDVHLTDKFDKSEKYIGNN